ncbi:MAG TPA: trypsin-like peptidase domain-containing protein [Candidatus Dependentiae bacterium]|nr:trypsin-like peptidase domain-containing protein [Candidatus Dependentiae bacterium]HRQ62427.1 trypsin-like peptidase domain-containing protein [Candidatus Dependentiae bacterium]
MKNRHILISYIFLFLTIVILFLFGYLLYKRQQRIEQASAQIYDDVMRVAIDVPTPEQNVVERVVTSSQLWRPIQEKVENTVVQIFSQIAELDLLQPYKTPKQGTSSGSGFFINADGDIITNAHVIDQASAIWIQIPALGKRVLDVEVLGVSPERDLALLRLTPDSLQQIKDELGTVPYLKIGDSDKVLRSDEVLALGYPLGQQSLKSTTGVVSGFEHRWIQTSAPINPGNSGGPLLNTQGEVVGVNNANIPGAQNVGYAIPISQLEIILPDLYKVKLLRKPFLGIVFNNATDALTEYLGNPAPGGAYIVEVVSNSTLDKAGVKRGDMLYEINNHRLDIFGEMRVPWSEDKVSLIDYVSRISIGEEIKLVVYRNGERKELKAIFEQAESQGVSEFYPGYEELDYEVFGGMVITPLTINHLQLLGSHAPGLAKYMDMKNRNEPTLIITHIFPSSHLYRSRAVAVGSTIHEVNGIKVSNLHEFRNALQQKGDNKFFTMRLSDNVARRSENVIVALEWDKLIEQEPKLAHDYRYPMTNTTKELLAAAQANKALQKATKTA